MHKNNLGPKFHSQPKEEIERGRKEERKVSSVLIFLNSKF